MHFRIFDVETIEGRSRQTKHLGINGRPVRQGTEYSSEHLAAFLGRSNVALSISELLYIAIRQVKESPTCPGILGLPFFCFLVDHLSDLVLSLSESQNFPLDRLQRFDIVLLAFRAFDADLAQLRSVFGGL